MPDGMGGAGIGAGGGALAAAVVYALDKFVGSGKAVKTLDEKFKSFDERLVELKTKIEGDVGDLKKLAERATQFAERLYDWHNIADPDDPSGRIWYFSVALRKLLASLETKISKLLDLLERLVVRFDKYNTTLENLITVTEKLQADVNALGLLVAGLDRGRR